MSEFYTTETINAIRTQEAQLEREQDLLDDAYGFYFVGCDFCDNPDCDCEPI